MLPWFVLNEVVKDELISDDLKLTIYQYEWFQVYLSLLNPILLNQCIKLILFYIW